MVVANKSNLVKLGRSLLGVEFSQDRLDQLVKLCSKKPADFRENVRDHISFGVMNWLTVIDRVLNLFGVETLIVTAEENEGFVSYINSGDSYTLTIFYFNGKLRIGCLADIPSRIA